MKFADLRKKRGQALKKALKAAGMTMSALADGLLPNGTQVERRRLRDRLAKYVIGDVCPPMDLLVNAAPLLGVDQPSTLYIELSDAERKESKEKSSSPKKRSPRRQTVAKKRAAALTAALDASPQTMSTLSAALFPENRKEAGKFYSRLRNYRTGRSLLSLQVIRDIAALLGVQSYKSLYVQFCAADDEEFKKLFKADDVVGATSLRTPKSSSVRQRRTRSDDIVLSILGEEFRYALRYDPLSKKVVGDGVEISGTRENGFRVHIEAPLPLEKILDLLLQ